MRGCKDVNIFTEGMSAKNAYILGLIFSDGNISWSGRNKNKLRMTLSMNEKEMISQIHSIMCTDRKLYEYKHPKGNEITYTVINSNQYFVDELISFGIVERKSSVVKYPQIDPRYEWHFVRGYFDGNGCVFKTSEVKGKKYYAVSITTGSEDFALGLKSFLDDKGVKNTIVSDSRRNTTFYNKIYSRDSLEHFINSMYEESGDWKLLRKYEKSREYGLL